MHPEIFYANNIKLKNEVFNTSAIAAIVIMFYMTGM